MGRLVSAHIIRKPAGRALMQFSPASVRTLNSEISDDDKPKTKQGDDNYAERIAKYVPAEVIAFFLAADKLFPDPNGGDAKSGTLLDKLIASYSLEVAAAVFAIGLIGTPAYIWQQRAEGEPWKVHAIMATLAFIVWAYAIHAHIFVENIYSSSLASFLVLFYTLVSGFVVPIKTLDTTH